MIPQNLMVAHKRAAFMNTGAWSDKAIKEAKKFGEALVVASSKESTFNHIPEIPAVPENIDYFYICANKKSPRFRRTSIISISAPTTRFTEQNSTNFRRRAAFR